MASISFVAAGTTYTDTVSGTTLTFNKPAGVVTGDLLIASAISYGVTDTVTTTLPAGWSLLSDSWVGVSQKLRVTIAAHDVLDSDGSTWTGSISVAHDVRMVSVVAYRGCAPVAQQFGLNKTVTTGGGTGGTTGSVTADRSDYWRVTSINCNYNFVATPNWSSCDTSERVDTTASNATPRGLVSAFYDSNGEVASGTQGSLAYAWSSVSNFANSISFFGLLKPAMPNQNLYGTVY